MKIQKTTKGSNKNLIARALTGKEYLVLLQKDDEKQIFLKARTIRNTLKTLLNLQIQLQFWNWLNTIKPVDLDALYVSLPIKVAENQKVDNLIKFLKNAYEVWDWLYQEKIVKLIYETNAGLLVSRAKKYANLSYTNLFTDPNNALNELINVGYSGLLKAINVFDVDTKNKFSTYAVWWINQAITRWYTDNSTIIKVPAHMTKNWNFDNEKYAKELESNIDFNPHFTITKHDDANTVREKLLNRSVNNFYNLKSVDETLLNKEQAFNQPQDENSPDKFSAFEDAHNNLEKILEKHLTTDEILVLCYFSGFSYHEINKHHAELKPREIATILNLPNSKISILLANAQKKLSNNKKALASLLEVKEQLNHYDGDHWWLSSNLPDVLKLNDKASGLVLKLDDEGELSELYCLYNTLDQYNIRPYIKDFDAFKRHYKNKNYLLLVAYKNKHFTLKELNDKEINEWGAKYASLLAKNH